MSYTTLISCREPHLKRFFLPNEGTVPVILECQRHSGHTGEHAALWMSGCVTWRYVAA